MEQGYDDCRFEKIVDEYLHCVICTEVLKDPVQCRRNEHHFCRSCITRHLQLSQNCPTCQESLTVETLGEPQRFLANTLELAIRENFVRGCRARREIREIKSDIAEMKAELRKVRSTQGEMFEMMSNLMRIERNMPQRSEASCVSSAQDVQAEIVVAGGCVCKSVEVFNMETKTWRSLSKMNQHRGGASSVLHQDRMFVIGGFSDQYLDTVEELKFAQENGHWVESQFKLPERSGGHVCVLYQNRLFVFGGRANDQVYDSIREIQLSPSYTVRLPGKMPQPICYHGAEIVNDKVYITGGRMTAYYNDARNTVLMFDPETNTCTELKPLPYPVSDMATVTWRENVVVLGGMDKERNVLNKVILYNVTTESYRMLREMRKKRSGCTAVIVGDNIIVMGGTDETRHVLNSVECYDFDTNIWTKFPAMTEARCDATAVVKYC